jgi:hypothetical protein
MGDLSLVHGLSLANTSRGKILIFRNNNGIDIIPLVTLIPRVPLLFDMDWARDNTGLSDKDLDKVFKYEEKSTTVVRMLAGNEVCMRELKHTFAILTAW